jgi:hypothetical protein
MTHSLSKDIDYQRVSTFFWTSLYMCVCVCVFVCVYI